MAAKGGNGDPLGCPLYPQLAEVRALSLEAVFHAKLAALSVVNLEAILVIPYRCFLHRKLSMVSAMSLEVIFVIPLSVLFILNWLRLER